MARAHKNIVVVVLMSTLVSLLGLVAASPAFAATNCSGAGNWFAGYNSTWGYDYGTQSHILTQTTHLCTNMPPGYRTDATEWAMLNAPDGELVQAGYNVDQDTGGNNPVFFAEYLVGNDFYKSVDYYDPGPAIGSTHVYTVQYQASQGVEIAGYDFTALVSVPIPFGTGAWATRQHEYYGEVQDQGTDIFGTSTNQVEHSSLAVQQPYHTCCQIVNQNLTLGPNRLPKFHITAVAFDGFFSYD